MSLRVSVKKIENARVGPNSPNPADQNVLKRAVRTQNVNLYVLSHRTERIYTSDLSVYLVPSLESGNPQYVLIQINSAITRLCIFSGRDAVYIPGCH